MSEFNTVERYIARILHKFPKLKGFSKSIYARLMFFKHKKNFKIKSTIEPVPYQIKGSSSFFGYYDKSPENGNGLVLAFITSRSTSLMPEPKRDIELAVFDGGEPILKLPLSTYNWQQGSRAHWLSDDLFIYNDYDAELSCYVSYVYSVNLKSQVKKFVKPVQDSFGTDYFISLNYQRLMTLRPDYGYRNLPLLSTNELNDLDNDGLWKVNYETSQIDLFISLAKACEIKPKPEMKNAVHKFNHVMISPNGSNFIFMHRYLIGQRRVDRLFLANSESGEIRILSDYGMVSHCFWVNDRTVLGYMRGPHFEDGYWLINIETGDFTPFQREKLKKYGDGHPHVYGDWFITDTYPDKSRMQTLILCNLKTGDVRELGEFFHDFRFQGEMRCDLHPRFSFDGNAVYFDSVFTGQRQLYRMELSE